MSEFTVASASGAYAVRIEAGAVSETLGTAAVIVIDERLRDLVGEDSITPVIGVVGAEETKTLTGCERILISLKEAGVKRGDLLLAVGGGVVQDAATFVSSFYMRGLPWVYCPTTAMAMADSCIGGKSSINVGGIKNLGGNIYPPKQVVIDPALAGSLSLEARISGLGEAVKICFAAGPESFARYVELAMPAAEFGQSPATEELLTHVLLAKKWFIEVDEFDRAERQLLNFGHTLAHALESATDFALPHGVAVALGVLGALAHPVAVDSDQTRLLADYCRDLLAPIRDDIADAADGLDWEAFDRAVSTDKKGTRQSVRLVLPVGAGLLSVVDLPRTPGTLATIRGAMAAGLGEVTG